MIGFDSQDGNDAHPAIGDTYNGVSNDAFHDHDNGSLNWLAADGHVKYLKTDAGLRGHAQFRSGRSRIPPTTDPATADGRLQQPRVPMR